MQSSCSCRTSAARQHSTGLLHRSSALQPAPAWLRQRQAVPGRPCQAACRIQAVLPGAEGHVQEAVNAVQHVVASAPAQLDQLSQHASSLLFTLADAAPDVPAVASTSSNSGGFLQPLTGFFEQFLAFLDTGLEKIGAPYSYGFAIILLTFIVKAATFPLTKKQVESTLAMQNLQPRIKEVQAKFKGRDQEMQLEVARIYKEAGVNPLAGCLPTLATLPVWIGLYRALSNVADEGLLKEGFFWIPSLAGPTSLAARQSGGGFSWLFPFVDGAPPIGWHDAGAYLLLPVLLVVSQFVSQKIISPSPASQDPTQQQTNAILKFLPLMIGYFSLNVPSGLTLYWFTNNLLTTAQQVWLKSSVKAPAYAATGTVVKTPASEDERIKKPTGKELNARRSPSKAAEQEAAPASNTTTSRKGGKKGEKFRALKAKEAAKKAAKLGVQAAAAATGNDASSAGRGVEAAAEAVEGSAPAQTQVREQLQVPNAAPAKDNSSKSKDSQNGNSNH
ncbi:hypothetical protein WJX72_003029 [[Myrmecia] bisecta]|uniref:Membrane insertase YidC/Oxa/ALB C-terminal domain-containing protein n=1 Tax=[Myrmecia] bisecta TaxID=41462 RepID=A0AAW1QPQ3_9CHLO